MADAAASPKPRPQRRQRQAWTRRPRRDIAGGVTGRIACILLLILLAAPLPAASDDGIAGLSRAPAGREEALGSGHPALLPVLDRLARQREHDGDFAAAAAQRRRALHIAIAAFGHGSPAAADALVRLARVEIDRRRYLDAEPLLIVANGIMDGRAEDKRLAAAILAGLARVAMARGDAGAALAWADKAERIEGADRRSAEPQRALGAALTAQERFSEAETVLRQALAFDRRTHGPEAAETARSLSQLGNLYLRWARPRMALPLLQEAAAIDQGRLGPTHPFIADDLHDLGLAYDALGRPERARRMFLAAVAVLERGAGRHTPRVAYAKLELSRLYRQAGDPAAADAAFSEARRILDAAEAEERRRERRT